MSSAADNVGNLGTYNLVVGPAKSPLGETWIARGATPGGAPSELVTLRRFGADGPLSSQELKVLSEAAEWALCVKEEGVIPTTELVVAGQQLAWVRPYLLGEPLRRLLQHCASKKQAPSVAVALRIAVDVLEAVVSVPDSPRRLASGALASCCLLGPDVIWISSDGRSRITDVGALAAAGSLDRYSKHPDLVAYRAPEQVGGFLADPRSDVFVAGILLWELLSEGRRLFAGGDLAAVAGAVFSLRVEDPGTPARPVDAGVVAIVMRALDRDPTRRFPGLREMAQAIHDLGDEAVATRASVAEYLATVSKDPLSREREVVAQLTGGDRTPKPDAQGQPAAAADTRPPSAPRARSTDPAPVTGSQPARASAAPGAKKADGTAAERVASSSRPSAKTAEAAQAHSPGRSWPAPAKKPQAAGSQPPEAASRSGAAEPTSTGAGPAASSLAKKPQAAGSQPPVAASRSSAAEPTSTGAGPAASSLRPSTRPNAASVRPSGERTLVPGIKPVTVSPRPSSTRPLALRSQPPASSAPPGPGEPARAVQPAAEPAPKVVPPEEEPAATASPSTTASPTTSADGGSPGKSGPPEEPSPAAGSGTETKAPDVAAPVGSEQPSDAGPAPSAAAAVADQPADIQGDAKADGAPRAAEPSTPATNEATPAAGPTAAPDTETRPADDEKPPPSEPVQSMPILSISEGQQEVAAEREADQPPAAADAAGSAPGEPASAPSDDQAPSPPRIPDAPAAAEEVEKVSAEEKAPAPVPAGAPAPAAAEPEQGRSTLAGPAVDLGSKPGAAPGREQPEAAATQEPPPPRPAPVPERKEPDIAPAQRVAAVAVEPFVDEATTRALKPRFPVALVLGVAAVLAGGIYWLSSGKGSLWHERPHRMQAEPQKTAPAVTSAPTPAPTPAAPEPSAATAPTEAAPAPSHDQTPTPPEPEAEPTPKASPISQALAGRAKHKPAAAPQPSEPAKVTKSAGATKPRKKAAAPSATPEKPSALDILRRLDKKRE
jgi:hypothetical protein